MFACACVYLPTCTHIQDNFHEKVRNLVRQLMYLLICTQYGKRNILPLRLCVAATKSRGRHSVGKSQSDKITTPLRAGAADWVRRGPQTLVTIALPFRCVAVCCIVLQCVTVFCSVLQCKIAASMRESQGASHTHTYTRILSLSFTQIYTYMHSLKGASQKLSCSTHTHAHTPTQIHKLHTHTHTHTHTLQFWQRIFSGVVLFVVDTIDLGLV